MTGGAIFCYVQARLQARHGARLEEAHWQALEGARSFSSYIDRTKTNALRRFTEGIPLDASAHVIEKRLRQARRGYAGEIASWMPVSWQPAVRWAALLPDLPILSYLLKGGAAWPWMAEDPVLAALPHAPPAIRSERLKEAGLGALAASAGEGALLKEWLKHWCLLWPAISRTEGRDLHTLITGVALSFERSANQASTTLRRDLAAHLIRRFRASAARPAAVFCHLGLAFLDIERLRGGLLRRLLLEGVAPVEAA
ncbi:MAG: hypothetical protein ACLP7P_11340 [Rhodomicrobium sp.]